MPFIVTFITFCLKQLGRDISIDNTTTTTFNEVLECEYHEARLLFNQFVESQDWNNIQKISSS